MPIVRTYQCPECFLRLDQTLDGSQWEQGPPECPNCSAKSMQQEYKPVALGGSNRSKATALAEDIAAQDYNVADISLDGKGGRNKVRYKDQAEATKSVWTAAQDAIQGAISAGRESRLKYGSGLDILQKSLKDGTQPDLIELSKKRSMRIW